jgi:hypothetical protein
MRGAACCAVLLACAGPGCRSRAPTPTEASSRPSAIAAVSVAASAPVSDPLLADDVQVPGLRVRSGSIQRASLWGFSDLTVDLQQLQLEIVTTKRGAPLAKLLPPAGLAVVNGGYFEADFTPSTWLKDDGKELAPKADTSRGGLLAVGRKRGFYVGPFAGLDFEPQLAIQSHPLIVEPEGQPGIHRDDGRRAARTVVCVADGKLHFIVISAPRGDGPTLFEAVALLREPPPRGFGCARALNLDGGPSSGVWFAPGVPSKQRAPTAAVAYAIAIVPASPKP